VDTRKPLVGLILLAAAVAGLLWVSVWSGPRKLAIDSIPGEDLVPLHPTGHHYRVEPGDTLFSIGSRFNISPVTLAQVNGLIDPNIIAVGQHLYVPSPGGWLPPIPVTYTVQAGDTVFSIAQNLGINPITLAWKNSLSPPYHVEVGELLYIPSAFLLPSALPTVPPTPPVIPSRRVEGSYPTIMELERSDYIQLCLNQILPGAAAVTTEPERATLEATTIPVPSPEPPFTTTLASQYEGFAVAHLVATNFDTELATEERQSLDQPTITWQWNIAPKVHKKQVVNASIEVGWESKDGWQTTPRQIWVGQFEIVVEKPFITWGQINIASWISGFFGSGLTLVWVYEQIKESKREPGRLKRMAPEYPRDLVVLDLRLENGVLAGPIEYVQAAEAGRLRVRWDVEGQPEDFLSVGNGVAYVLASTVETISRSDIAHPISLGDFRYRHIEGLRPQTDWLEFILILPEGHTATEIQPMPLSARDFEGRIALFWALKGDPAGHARVDWQIKEVEVDLASEIERINRGYSSYGAAIAPRGDVAKVKILFLAADPTDASRLRLGEEAREIREKLQLAALRDRFELHQRTSVRAEDLSQALLDIQPRIVHFSGHGTTTGALCFEDKLGRTHPIRPNALAALFKQFTDPVECVVLNACYSEPQASAIAKHIDYVVGMNRAIGDRAAIAFAVGFYQAIGAGRSIEDAHELGCVQIMLQGIPEHLTPVLIKKV
jgi:LysM repeat protein